MNRIDERFKRLKIGQKKLFIAYICAGDPDLATTKELVLELDRTGVNIIELGVPFSDPLADGPTIQRASQRALKNRVNLPKIFSMIKQLRQKTGIPLVLMTYYNPVYAYGVRRFVKDAKKAGADGIIVPDLSCEDAGDLISASRPYDFDTIFLVAPTSTDDRIRLIAERSKGFIYYVSLTGITGVRQKLPGYVKTHLKRIRRITDKPVCIGFGISTPKQVSELAKYCDGVIVGSAIIDVLESNLSNKRRIPQEVARFVKSLIRVMS